MSERINAFEAIAMVPGWVPELAEIEVLQGGLTNRSYYIRVDGMECVLRLESAQSAPFRFDRTLELRILERAAGAGLAPKVVFADVDAGVLVTEFLHGRVWEAADLKSSQNLEALAALLCKVHALPKSGLQIDIAKLASTYQHYLAQRHGPYAFASTCVDIVRSVPVNETLVCCHNDIVAANIVADDDLQLIDWEFACDHDPLFDLASAIGFHDLTRAQADVLLNAYSGGAGAEQREHLAEQVRVYDAIQWLWLAIRQLIFPDREQARRLEALQQRIR